MFQLFRKAFVKQLLDEQRALLKCAISNDFFEELERLFVWPMGGDRSRNYLMLFIYVIIVGIYYHIAIHCVVYYCC